MKKYPFLLDYLLPAFLVCALTLHPNFLHGIIDFYETGLYLPFINEVFHGKLIFKDLVIHRGPLEILLPAFLMKIFGIHINLLTSIFYFGNILTIVFTLYIARQFLRTRFFLYLLIPVLIAKTFPPGFCQNWGGFRFTSGLIAIFCALRALKNYNLYWFFFSGVFTSIGFLFSSEIGIFSFLSVFCTLILKKVRCKDIVLYFLGVCLILFPFLLYFCLKGGISTYIKTNFIVPFNSVKIYHQNILNPDIPFSPVEALSGILKPSKPIFRYAWPLYFYIILAAYLLKLFIKKGRDLSTIMIFCVGLYGFFMYLGSFRQIKGPQFAMALQLFLIFIFIFLEKYYIFLRTPGVFANKKTVLKLNRVIFSYIIFFFLFNSIFTIKSSLRYCYNLHRFVFHLYSKGGFQCGKIIKPISIKRARGVIVADLQADEIDGVVNYIQKNTDPNETVFCFPNLGTYNFLIDRRCFSRFCFSDMAFYHPKWTKEFFFQLYSSPPRYIILKKEPDTFETLLREYPLGKYRMEVRKFIQNNYNLKASFNLIEIYRAKNS